MVDCRAGPGAPPQELAQSPPNGAQQADSQQNQVTDFTYPAGGSGGSGGDAGAHSLSSAASTPPSTSSVVTYSGGAGSSSGVSTTGGAAPAGTPNVPPYGVGGPCTPYVCGVKSMMWCSPQSPPPAPLGPLPVHGPPPMPALAAVQHVPHLPHITPPPLGVNPHVFKSTQVNGADLPMNDIPTLRYYYNLGVECMWAVYGPPPLHAPPRHYSPRDLAQDMQHMSMHDRGMNQPNPSDQNHKHKPSQGNDKSSINNQGKGNGQRPLLGPRFKRGGNHQDGNMNSNHQNKPHNMGNKGPNHRYSRNPHGEGRSHGGGGVGGGGGYGGGGEGECVVEPPLIPLPYIPYPPAPAPPVYPIQYYPIEAEPGMIGMMGGMGYVSYEESVEYSGMQPYYGAPHHYPPPPPLPPPHHHHQPPHHAPHHHQHQHHMEPK